MCSSWGWEQGEMQRVAFDKRFQLADKMMASKKFQKIADLAGRFKNIVNGSSATVPTHGMDEIVDIGQGDDIARIVPSEALKLRRTPKLFFKDMVEGKLLVYNMKGVEPMGKGPIIMCMDMSGSMEGTRECWAKAVVLALMALAEKQNRAFGIIVFESRVTTRKFFPKGMKPSLEDKIDIANIGASGGTDFYPPLKAAFEMRGKDLDLKPADIVFVTDDEFQMSPEREKEILKLKKETEVRIFGMAINESYPGSSGKTLEAFCDQIAVVNSLGEIQQVKDMIINAATDLKK
jgi:uncharacterized protein with von Willebrand factor type A (vWA) domain